MKTQNDNKVQLKQWLFNKPILFTILFFVSGTLLAFLYSIIQSYFGIENTKPVIGLLFIAFVFSALYTMKKLPHNNVSQNDFIAITNGASIISIATSLLSITGFAIYGHNIQQKIMFMYMMHPTTFAVIFFTILLFSLYILGVAVSGFYAKYKRAKTLGISTWKIILSMPFAFLMMWTPGYLIKDKTKTNSNLSIKSNWFSRFNNWVVANTSNLVFVFLSIVLVRSMIAGLTPMLLTASLLIIYTLWYIKHKKDFIKNINKGYALTAVGINLAILIASITASIVD